MTPSHHEYSHSYATNSFAISGDFLKEHIRLDFLPSSAKGEERKNYSFFYQCMYSEGNYERLHSAISTIEELIYLLQDVFQRIQTELQKDFVSSYVSCFIDF